MNHSHDRLIHWALAYDLTNGLLGRRRKGLREMFADDLELQAGDRVLDVGCGTGQLAMTFADRVAPTGSVAGIDAAPEMIKRATSRARKQKLPIAFQVAFAQRLPFPNDSFHAVARQIAGGEFGPFAGIDLNMGCPERKIVKRGACAGLRPGRALEQIDQLLRDEAGARGVDVAVALGGLGAGPAWGKGSWYWPARACAIHHRKRALRR